MLICKRSGKPCTDRIRRNSETEESSAGFAEEKGRIQQTAGTARKRISETTDQYRKEEESAGKYSGTVTESAG